ncbi:hypothetical protein ACHAXR_008142 [Thalassiosira sp. AJA248-18]
MCNTPSALDMIASVCGKGAIVAVEQKLRGNVEFKVQEDNIRKEASRSNAKDMNEQARQIFNELAEKINLKCPRCQAAFHDYDGCNSLTCSIPSCKASFCAICLKDCGRDAHQHVQEVHGGLFDKGAFERSKILRAQAHIAFLKDKLSRESFELKQLVLNHIEKAKLTEESGTSNASAKKAAFFEKTKASLLLATRNDRLSLLSNPEDYNRRKELSRDDISPRCAVPRNYRLSLSCTQGDVYRISLDHNLIEGEDYWQPIGNIEAHFKENPKVESLLNISQALRCAVVAFEGHAGLYQTSRGVDIPKGHKLGKDEVSFRLRAIDRDGKVMDPGYDNMNMHRRLVVAGLNQNKRMILLEKHVEITPVSDLLFEPLQHMIGAGKPRSVITEIEMEIPNSQVELNTEQQKVAHPLRLKTAMEVAGPPGTGKTKTIVELVRALLQCTSYDILLLSERNGAINAVAEKFMSESLTMTGKKMEITDLQMWTSVMTYGAGENMGDSTKLFTLGEKLRFHPELVDLEGKRDLLIAASKSLSQALRNKLAEIVLLFGRRFNEGYAANRSKEIEGNKVELSSPLSIISAVEDVTQDMQDLFDETKKTRSTYVEEESASDLITRHSDLLGRLIYIRTSKEREAKESLPWDAKEATLRLRFILARFVHVLELDMFSPDNARDLYKEKTAVDEEYKTLFTRLEAELPALARLHMSTIGSSHRLPGDKNNNDGDLARAFGQLSLDNFDDEIESDPPKETIVIFDESGCIPSFELLGLTRLGRPIKSLVLVGDKHQLPPYDPMQGRRFGRGNSFGATGMRKGSRAETMRSLLDSSALTIDTGKVMLTTQYRVSKDIADILNHRVYRGQYNTCPRASIPLSGLRMIHVPWEESPKRKYVNPNEVRKGLELLNELSLDYDISSTLVITPITVLRLTHSLRHLDEINQYKNQQREFEFQINRLKRQNHVIETTVLTIDQCQGQEADAVILSLVQRPTRFLTLNRLNVALSRVRNKLYVLTDFKDLQQACRDKDWECAHLVADLLSDFN